MAGCHYHRLTPPVNPQLAAMTGGHSPGSLSWDADITHFMTHEPRTRATASTMARHLLQAQQRSRVGPKSQGCTSAFSSLRGYLCFAVIFLNMLSSASATDARVMLPEHHGSIGANSQPSSFPNSGAKPHGDWSHISRRQGNTQPIRNRAFLRAFAEPRTMSTTLLCTEAGQCTSTLRRALLAPALRASQWTISRTAAPQNRHLEFGWASQSHLP